MPTKIEWTEETWNPMTGCTQISPGCKRCYAKRMAQRLRGRSGYPDDDPFDVTLRPYRLDHPLRWRESRRVFVCSMGDLFHPLVSNEFIAAVFGIMAAAEEHTFQVLTKRPEHMLAWFKRIGTERVPPQSACFVAANQVTPITAPFAPKAKQWPLPNVWLGVTAENQEAADERIPLLLQTPAAVRFVSCEPLLGPVNLRHMDAESAGSDEMYFIDALTGRHDDMGRPCRDVEKLDWVIAGGETGPGARRMKAEWARSLRDQCKAACVPFFFKRWGPDDQYSGDLLDGVQHHEYPEVQP
jgi:protein gp37